MGQKSGTLPNFYPRPPRGGRLEAEQCEEASDCISIHALREEGDLRIHPHISKRRAISIHALREEGDHVDNAPDANYASISIHALREEGDGQPMILPRWVINFYPRPPRGGRRSTGRSLWARTRFLSTPSARRATWDWTRRNNMAHNFYPRPPRGGRHGMFSSS